MEMQKTEDTGKNRYTTSLVIARPLEELWMAITTLEKEQPYYYYSTLVTLDGKPLKAGSPIAYQVGSERKDAIRGEVTLWQPPYRFAHTFRFPRLDEPESEAHWHLERLSESETRISVYHTGLLDSPQTYEEVSTGWSHILHKLRDYQR